MPSEAEKLAAQFHDMREALAPTFGYPEKDYIKTFDPSSDEGRLTIAVFEKLLNEMKEVAVTEFIESLQMFKKDIGETSDNPERDVSATAETQEEGGAECCAGECERGGHGG